MQSYTKELIENRRKFRQIAETGWLEMETTIEIIKYLKALGYNVKYGKEIHSENRMGLPTDEEYKEHIDNIDFKKLKADFDISEILEGYTGCIAEIKAKNPGKTIGIRFDIDALPFHETENKDHIPNIEGFRSKNKFATHACGHDGHIAIGLGVAKYISENLDNLSGTFRLIVQPAEEGVRGARSMVSKGAADGLDYIIGSHIGMDEEPGVLGIGTTKFLATSKFDIDFKGVSSHAGSKPENGKNALLAAASATLNLHTMPQYSSGVSRINVGILKAGNGRNVIAKDAHIELEVRSDIDSILQDLVNRTKNIIKGSAISYDVDYEIKEVGGAAAFNTIHPEFVDLMSEKLKEKGFKIHKAPELNGSEDISYMLKKVEENGGFAIHYLLGTNLKAPHHNDAFDYDEDVLSLGLRAIIATIKIFNEMN